MFVQVNDVWKKYPGKWALQGVTFDVSKGKVLGVLGENGAGKSTLFRIIASVTRPSKGNIMVDGIPVGLETRKIVAFLPEINPFYGWMKVMEQFEFLAAFYEGWDMDKTRELLKFMDLPDNDKIGTLSRGQQAKLKMVFAFSWPAKLVLMDEPLGGIDPPARKKIINTFFHEFRFGEQTIIMSTHMVSEVEEFVEDVFYLKKGKIVLSGEADRLREEKGTSLVGIFEEIAG
ncbi:MAG: ABC transporter ATP-binding protein [Candidatus Latescibacteria bacterium]|nr:ABC transporter ATP-binding protein [Candidatus Latescibacterota bacterium]